MRFYARSVTSPNSYVSRRIAALLNIGEGVAWGLAEAGSMTGSRAFRSSRGNQKCRNDTPHCGLARGCPAVVGCNLAGKRVGPAGEGSDHGPGAWLAGRTGKFCKQLGRFCKRTGRFCGQSPKNSGQWGSPSGQSGSPSEQAACFSCFRPEMAGGVMRDAGCWRSSRRDARR